jgi:hypothetical protein
VIAARRARVNERTVKKTWDILDCGGKRSATPLSRAQNVIEDLKTSHPLENEPGNNLT